MWWTETNRKPASFHSVRTVERKLDFSKAKALRCSATNLENCIGKSGKESISWMTHQQSDEACKRDMAVMSEAILEFRAESLQRLFTPPRR